jgi:large subunit ribosomal protein L34
LPRVARRSFGLAANLRDCIVNWWWTTYWYWNKDTHTQCSAYAVYGALSRQPPRAYDQLSPKQQQLAKPFLRQCKRRGKEVQSPIPLPYITTRKGPLTTILSRPLSILSQSLSRPTATPSTAVRAIAADIPTTAFVQLPSLTLLQVRGAKRDTYDPSHRVRKRRHGFLSRLRSKNGRNTLKRRKLRGRNTLSH